MQLTQSTDKDNRIAFKDVLANKVNAALTAPPPEEIQENNVILLLPHNFKDLDENQLHFSLMQNRELKHSRQSATMAVEIVHGKRNAPENVSFQYVELTNPVEIPKFAKETEVKRSPGRPLTAPDSLAIKMDEDIDKRADYKHYLADKAELAFNEKPTIEKAQIERTVLLPEGYESMNPGELHFALIRNPEFKHTNEQAVVTADMLSGRIGTPDNVVFKAIAVDNIQMAPALIKTAGTVKVAKTEPSLLTRAKIPMDSEHYVAERVLLLPENFAYMTETQLHFALSHNREYGHSYESTYEVLDILFGRIACPAGTVFSTVLVDRPVERAY